MPHDRIMIEVKNLTKVYGPKRAVDNISFDVPSGEVLGFLGPNGAGKSTTMKIITCFISPSSGEVLVGGKPVLEQSLAVREQVGYLPEDTPLYPDLTPLEFLEFVAAMRQVEPGQRQDRIRRVADVCGLYGVLGQPISELSKGFRQRVGLAQAMVHDPPILILDEPTSGLDPNQIVEIRELIKEIGKQKTVVLSTHILPEVQATCGRVIIIADGKMVADGSPHELAHRDSDNTYRLLVDAEEAGAEQVQQKLGAVSGVAKVVRGVDEDGATAWVVSGKGSSDLRRELFTCARDAGWYLLELQRQEASLEDVFRKLTKE